MIEILEPKNQPKRIEASYACGSYFDRSQGQVYPDDVTVTLDGDLAVHVYESTEFAIVFSCYEYRYDRELEEVTDLTPLAIVLDNYSDFDKAVQFIKEKKYIGKTFNLDYIATYFDGTTKVFTTTLQDNQIHIFTINK